MSIFFNEKPIFQSSHSRFTAPPSGTNTSKSEPLEKATKFWLERSREDSFWLLKIGDENTSCKRHEVFNWYVAEETLFGILL